MSRFVSGGLLVLALAAAPLLGSAVGKAPPVAMPEAPPELPAGAVDLSPPRDASHDHAGHMHDHAGHTHGAPADRRPSLVPAPWSPTPDWIQASGPSLPLSAARRIGISPLRFSSTPPRQRTNAQ